MPPRKANKGAFGKGNQGYGLRNAAVDAADEPDAAGPEAQGGFAVLGRFAPFLCRALLAFGSETACKRALEQVQRVADTSSQPPPLPASEHRMRLVPMKDMLYRDGLLRWVIDRMRRGTTDRAGGLTEPLQRLCDGCQLPSS